MTLYRNRIYQWEGDATQPYSVNFTWESGRKLVPKKVTLNCGRVIADTGDRQSYCESIEAYNQAVKRNNAIIANNQVLGAIGELPIGYSLALNEDNITTPVTVSAYSGDFNLTLYFYVDDVLKFTKDVYASDEIFRLPSGFRGRAFEVKVVGNVRVRRVDLAPSVKELMGLMQQKKEEG